MNQVDVLDEIEQSAYNLVQHVCLLPLFSLSLFLCRSATELSLLFYSRQRGSLLCGNDRTQSS